MKRIFGLAIVSMAIFACNDAETPTINEDTHDSSPTVTAPPPATDRTYTAADGDVTYREKKVMVMKNGAWVEAEDDVKLDNGVVIYRTGKVKKEGKEVELEDGTVVTRDGNFFDKTGQAIENAWDETKEGAKKAGNEIEKGANKVEDQIDGGDHHDDEKK